MRAPVITREMIGRGLGWETWKGHHDVRDYGVILDGVTDNAAAMQSLFEAVPSNGLIYIPNGTLLVNSNSVIDKSVNIIGNGKGSVIKVGFAGYAFSVSGGSNLCLEDFAIDGNSLGTGFELAAALELLRAEKITFFDCANNYCMNAASTIDIDRIEIIACTIKDCLNGMRFAGECISATVLRNLIDTLTGTSSVIGFQLGHNTAAMQDAMLRYIISQNVFLDLTTTGVDSEAHAVLAYGREVTINDNKIKTITNGGGSTQGAEAIYVKAKFSTISGNNIVDGGKSENGQIALKGASRTEEGGVKGFATIVTNNIMVQEDITTDIGIFIASDDILVAGNYFEGMSGSAIRTSVKLLNNISIENNRIIAHNGVRAIRISHQGTGLKINNNFIADQAVMAIVVEPQVGPLKDIEINNNTIIGGDTDNVKRGIYIAPLDEAGVIEGLQICGNNINLVSTTQDVYGIHIDVTAAADPAITNFVMQNNNCSKVSGHDAGGTRPLYYGGVSEQKIHDFLISNNFFYGPYQSKAGNFDVEFEHCGDAFNNNGAGGLITATLPVAQPGLIFHFSAVDNQDLRIDPDGADEIIGGSGAGNWLSLATLGETVLLECVIDNEWIIRSSHGTLVFE